MTTPIEYRLTADECFQWARDAKTNSVRLTYLGSGLKRRCAKMASWQYPCHHIDADTA